MKKLCTVVCGIVALLALMGIQSKAQDEICACVHKTNGKMRQVTEASQCENAEVFVCWNTGPLPSAGKVCPDGWFVTGFNTDGTIICAPLCEDQDGDNYCGQKWWGTLSDCDDNDPTVYPGAEEVCDDGSDSDCDGLNDEEDPDCALTKKTVFVTSRIYQGDLVGLGGMEGADAACQACAETAGLEGEYKAWISTRPSECPDQTFTRWLGAYALVDDTIVANSWTDLTDGTLLSPINIDENGSEVIDSYVWTSTEPNGALLDGQSGGGCYRYTKSGSSYSSRRGSTSAKDRQWTDIAGWVSCNSWCRLYCFEQ
jgi:hypothetical protein